MILVRAYCTLELIAVGTVVLGNWAFIRDTPSAPPGFKYTNIKHVGQGAHSSKGLRMH